MLTEVEYIELLITGRQLNRNLSRANRNEPELVFTNSISFELGVIILENPRCYNSCRSPRTTKATFR